MTELETDSLFGLVIGMTELDFDVGKISFELGLGADGLLSEGEFIVKVSLDCFNCLLHVESVSFMLFSFFLQLAREGGLHIEHFIIQFGKSLFGIFNHLFSFFKTLSQFVMFL